MDMAILDFIQLHMRSAFGDAFFRAVTWLGNGGIIWIALAAVLLIIPKTRKTGLVVALSLAIEAVISNLILKPIVARPRPFQLNTAIHLLIKAPRDYSFPSGHTGAAFAAVSALFIKKSRLRIPSLILALLIAFSRLYLYVHFPSDVLAGAIIGILSGFPADFIARKIQHRLTV